MIKFADPLSEYHNLRAEIDANISRVLLSGNYVLGAYVENFETQFSSYVGSSHCVGVGSGLDALVLALKALDIGEGDEVLVPSHTFFATWLAVLNVGAIPIGVQVRKDTFTIDPDSIEAKINHRTRAIIPVHLYGNSCEMDEILFLAKKYRLYVVEDAAQAHGAQYKGRRIGAHGDLIAWSFYPTKNLGCFGDGGALTTDNAQIATKLRALRNYGSTEKYIHDYLGLNSRLDEIQAAILTVKLSHLDALNSKRAQIAEYYFQNIYNASVTLPKILLNQTQVWHLYVIQCEQRDKLKNHLQELGIPSLIHYPIIPANQTSILNLAQSSTNFVDDTGLTSKILSLPMHPFLSQRDLYTIVQAINTFQ